LETGTEVAVTLSNHTTPEKQPIAAHNYVV